MEVKTARHRHSQFESLKFYCLQLDVQIPYCVICMCSDIFRLELTVLLMNEDLFVTIQDADSINPDIAHIDYQQVFLLISNFADLEFYFVATS